MNINFFRIFKEQITIKLVASIIHFINEEDLSDLKIN